MEERILYYLEDIDVRRAMGQSPRRLKSTGFTIPKKYIYFYFHKSNKLMKICPGCHTEVLSPVDYSASSGNFFVFNLNCDEYTYEFYDVSGYVMIDPTYNTPIITRGPIKFIGIE
jgi:hypothetical protein